MRKKILLYALAFFLLPLSAFATVNLYVDTDNGSNSNNGSTWSLAFADAYHAVSALPGTISDAYVIHCRGATADTTSWSLLGHSTTSTNTITIQTDVVDSQTGLSDRPSGVWDNSKYHMVFTNQGGIGVNDDFVNIYGIQFHTISTTAGGHTTDWHPPDSNAVQKLADCIFWGISTYTNDLVAVHSGDYGTLYAWNNVIYGYNNGSLNIAFTGYRPAYLYNNTIYNCSTGIYTPSTTTYVVAVNNLFISVHDVSAGYQGALAAGTDYNATDNAALCVTGSLGNTLAYCVAGQGDTHEQFSVSTTGLFKNVANYDFHLLSTSSAQVKGSGKTDPGSGLFSDDITGNTRTGSWDIGAFMYVPSGSTYWVHTYGTSASWAGCLSATDPGGTCVNGNCANYCSLNTANQNVAAGQTVRLKGGTYTLSGGNIYNYGVAPPVTGTSESPITYIAASSETPIINSSGVAYDGIYLSSQNYIVIDGLTFNNVNTLASITGSSYNEIKNCTFGPSTGDGSVVSGMFTLEGGSTHNWIHNNTFRNAVGSDPCAEGEDLIRIGAGYSIGSVDPGNDYNTIENNIMYHAAHTVLDNYGKYNVIRNNVSHNEPWITTCTVGQTGKEISYDTSSSSVSVGTGAKTFTVSAGKTYANGSPIGFVRTSDHSQAMSALVTSYSSTTLVVNVLSSTGSGTYTDWTVSKGNYPQYVTASYDGDYGHRNFQMTDDYGRDGNFTLLEGNRLGNASNNPGNGGPMNLDLTSSRNIVRYNFIFNGMAAGIYFKYASSDLASGAILSTTSVPISIGTPTFTIPTGLHLTSGQTIRVWATSDHTQAMTGTVTSYNSGTGALVTNIDTVNGSGTYASWQIFWNGANGGVNNRIYHNTIYHNGYGYDWRNYGYENVAYGGQGIGQVNAANAGSTGNVIKNNIIFNNKEGAVCSFGLYTGDGSVGQCSAQAWDTVTNNYTGDPGFANADLTQPTSTTIPTLTLASPVPAGSGATYLTTATNSGSSSQNLTVADALYFQDGSWGSNLARGVTLFPDQIAIGAYTNTVQISSINYATNTITLASPVSWSNGAAVWLYKKSDGAQVLFNSTPAYGADPGTYAYWLVRLLPETYRMLDVRQYYGD